MWVRLPLPLIAHCRSADRFQYHWLSLARGPWSSFWAWSTGADSLAQNSCCHRQRTPQSVRQSWTGNFVGQMPPLPLETYKEWFDYDLMKAILIRKSWSLRRQGTAREAGLSAGFSLMSWPLQNHLHRWWVSCKEPTLAGSWRRYMLPLSLIIISFC